MAATTVKRQFVVFVLVGAANTLVTYALFVLLGLVLPAPAAYAISFGVGLLWVVFGSSRLVFGFRGHPWRLAAFAGWYLLLFGLGQLVIALTRPEGFLELAITGALIAVVTVPLSFLGGRYLFAPAAPSQEEQ